MKIKYEFVTGTVEVEVSAEWADVVKECDRVEFNDNQRETRRHTTLNNGCDEAEWLACEDYNPCNIIEVETEAARVRKAFSKLSPSQKDLIEKVFIEDMSVSAYAELCGVDQSAISHRIATIRKKLKKLL